MILVTSRWQLLPDLADYEYVLLKSNLLANGWDHRLSPIFVDENGNILDGHHRARACNEVLTETGRDIEPETRVLTGMSDAEKAAFIMRLNVTRRQLSGSDRIRLVQKYLTLSPNTSNNKIAKAAGTSAVTVSSHRAKLGLAPSNAKGSRRPPTIHEQRGGLSRFAQEDVVPESVKSATPWQSPQRRWSTEPTDKDITPVEVVSTGDKVINDAPSDAPKVADKVISTPAAQPATKPEKKPRVTKDGLCTNCGVKIS